MIYKFITIMPLQDFKITSPALALAGVVTLYLAYTLFVRKESESSTTTSSRQPKTTSCNIRVAMDKESASVANEKGRLPIHVAVSKPSPNVTEGSFFQHMLTTY